MLKRVEYGFPEILRERLAQGRPSQAILEDWAAMASSLDREPEAVAAALKEAAEATTADGAANVAPRSAIGVAVVELNGELALVDEVFSRWFGGTPDVSTFRSLIRQALKDGQANGLIEGQDGAAIAACAAERSSTGRLGVSPAIRVRSRNAPTSSIRIVPSSDRITVAHRSTKGAPFAFGIAPCRMTAISPGGRRPMSDATGAVCSGKKVLARSANQSRIG